MQLTELEARRGRGDPSHEQVAAGIVELHHERVVVVAPPLALDQE